MRVFVCKSSHLTLSKNAYFPKTIPLNALYSKSPWKLQPVNIFLDLFSLQLLIVILAPQHCGRCSICQVPPGEKEAGGSEGPVVVNVMFVVSSPCWCIVSQDAAAVCREEQLGHCRCSLISSNAEDCLTHTHYRKHTHTQISHCFHGCCSNYSC